MIIKVNKASVAILIILAGVLLPRVAVASDGPSRAGCIEILKDPEQPKVYKDWCYNFLFPNGGTESSRSGGGSSTEHKNEESLLRNQIVMQSDGTLYEMRRVLPKDILMVDPSKINTIPIKPDHLKTLEAVDKDKLLSIQQKMLTVPSER